MKQLLRTEDADLIRAASMLLGSDYIVAEVLGVSRRAVQRWTQGLNPVPAAMWEPLAKAIRRARLSPQLAKLADETTEALIRRALGA